MLTSSLKHGTRKIDSRLILNGTIATEDHALKSLQITNERQDHWLAASPVLILVLMLALVLSGCGQSARTSDPDEGRKALQTVLEAWKNGEKPEAFAQQSPSIHASDGDWKSGLALQGYHARDEARLVGTDLNYAVDLELKTPRGQLVKKTATYAVTTHPQVLVLRMDE
jgi:hypothetical protein